MPEKLSRLLTVLRSGAEPNIRFFLTNRQPLVWLLALAIGLAVAVAAILFRLAIGAVQYLWLGTSAETVGSVAATINPLIVFLFGCLVATSYLEQIES